MPHPMPSPRSLERNVSVLKLMNFLWMFIVLMPVIVPYFGQLGLTDGEVFEVQAIFGLSVVLLEVPTGYVSDLVGRRGCLILAGVLHGIAFSLLVFVRGFWGVVIFEVVAALGVCLFSGTDVALLYDSLEALGQESARRGALGLRLFWMQAGETAAALMGGWLALMGLSEVAIGNAIVGWLPLAAALCLVEVPLKRMDHGGHLQNFSEIRRVLFTQSPLVRRVLMALVAYGLATLLAVWAFQGFWAYLQIDVLWFGYLWAGYNLTVAIVGRLAHRVEARLGVPKTIIGIAFLPVIGYASMGLLAAQVGPQPSLAGAVIGVLLGLFFQLGRGLTQVLLKDELNQRVAPSMRATANSISSLGVRLGYAIYGPILGHLIDSQGYATAFASTSGMFVIVAVVIALPLAANLRPMERPCE